MFSDQQILICVVPPDPGLSPLLRSYMSALTINFIKRACVNLGRDYKVESAETMDSALHRFHGSYDYILFLAEGLEILDATILKDLYDDVAGNERFLIGGMIQEWGDEWYELHHQLVLVRTDNWQKCGCPEYGNWDSGIADLCVLTRSQEVHLNAQFCPVSIEKTQEVRAQRHSKQGWNIINQTFKNDFALVNWSAAIRGKRTYYYPESETEAFLQAIELEVVVPNLKIKEQVSFLEDLSYYKPFMRDRNLMQEKFESVRDSIDARQGDRDQQLLKHILSTDRTDRVKIPKNHASAHIGRDGTLLHHDFKTPTAFQDFNQGDERIVLAILPSWGVIFPPYGLAKVAGTLRKEGFACKVYDLNIQLYHHLLKTTGEDYWRSEKFFYWEDQWFFNECLLEHVDPYIDLAVEAILNDNPTLVGFSTYTSNSFATAATIRKLRERRPDLPIVLGGPGILSGEKSEVARLYGDSVNFLFVGEAEENLIAFLRDGRHRGPLPLFEFVGNTESRITLDDKAYADFSDYRIEYYLHPDGVSIETSRGCIAECSFCSETYFWKFRSMSPARIIDEMRFQLETFGVRRFWFVDSLVNGNLKHFQQVVDLIIANDLNIGWNSYARCDGRMTKEFISRIATSGCTALSFGVESGSQKVLNDMRKKIEIWEIEQNLRDCFETKKIWTHVNWIIGFPTEDCLDYYHSNVLVYNSRQHIYNLSPGMGCGPSTFSDLETRYALYGIAWKEKPWDNLFLQAWYTHGYKNTQLHRFVRIKLFHVWLEILSRHARSTIENSQRHADIEKCFVFERLDEAPLPERVEQECNIDFRQFEGLPDESGFAASIGNEFLPFVLGLHKVFGAYKLTLNFNPALDFKSWGNMAINYDSVLTVTAAANGEFKLRLRQKFKHCGLNTKQEENFVRERELVHGDMSFESSYLYDGNFKRWYTTDSQVTESIHKVFTKKKPLTAIAQPQ